MEELGIISSFNPLDALESISQIYSAKQLSKVEIKKIQEQTQNFNKWLYVQRNESKEIRYEHLSNAKELRQRINRMIDAILDKPELAMTYNDILNNLLKANNELAQIISNTRIQGR